MCECMHICMYIHIKSWGAGEREKKRVLQQTCEFAIFVCIYTSTSIKIYILYVYTRTQTSMYINIRRHTPTSTHAHNLCVYIQI